jgi:hypothetical protein
MNNTGIIQYCTGTVHVRVSVPIVKRLPSVESVGHLSLPSINATSSQCNNNITNRSTSLPGSVNEEIVRSIGCVALHDDFQREVEALTREAKIRT